MYFISFPLLRRIRPLEIYDNMRWMRTRSRQPSERVGSVSEPRPVMDRCKITERFYSKARMKKKIKRIQLIVTIVPTSVHNTSLKVIFPWGFLCLILIFDKKSSRSIELQLRFCRSFKLSDRNGVRYNCRSRFGRLKIEDFMK